MRRSLTEKEDSPHNQETMEDTNRQQDLDSAAQFFATESTRTSNMPQDKPNAGDELQTHQQNQQGDENTSNSNKQHDDEEQQQQQQQPVEPSTRSSQATDSAARFFETMQSEKKKSNSNLGNSSQQQQQQSSKKVATAKKESSSSNLRRRGGSNNDDDDDDQQQEQQQKQGRNNNSNSNLYRQNESVLSSYSQVGGEHQDHEHLFSCCSHPSSCYEAMVCLPCMMQRQLTTLQPETENNSNAMCLLYAVSWFFVVPAIRHEVSNRFGKQEACCYDFAAGVLCPQLSLAQTHRQLSYLGTPPKGWFLEPYLPRME